MPAWCSPRGLWCAGTYTVTARSGATTSTPLGVPAGGRWHTPIPIRRPTESCRRSLAAGGAASRLASISKMVSPGSAGRNFLSRSGHAALGINRVRRWMPRIKLAHDARGNSPRVLVIQKAPQLAASARVLELAQRLGLDLADALARDRELLADLFQRVVGIHADAEAHAQHALLAGRQGCQHARRGFAQIGLNRGVDRQDRVLVLDEIAKVGILLVADRGFQRQRLLGDL